MQYDHDIASHGDVYGYLHATVIWREAPDPLHGVMGRWCEHTLTLLEYLHKWLATSPVGMG